MAGPSRGRPPLGPPPGRRRRAQHHQLLSQQSAEKALKALLFHLGEELVIGHAVQGLCQKAATLIPELAPRCPHWAFLDGFYLTTRYPDALPGGIPARAYDQEAAQMAVGLAQEVIDFVKWRVGGP